MILVGVVAFGAALLTLFSGFGLGTLLLPAFALSFPPQVAVAATAVVHLANNLFKLVLLGRHADRGVVLRFALPAVLAAALGATLLGALAHGTPWLTWSQAGLERRVTPLGVTIGGLVVAMAIFELSPLSERLRFPRAALPLGGLVSGFLGGLSGHQGAFRAAFLVQLGLSREAFVATGVVCAVCIDVTRLAIYGTAQLREHFALSSSLGPEIGVGVLAAFCGSFFGSRLVKKVTMQGLQRCVGVMLVLVGGAIAAGIV